MRAMVLPPLGRAPHVRPAFAAMVLWALAALYVLLQDLTPGLPLRIGIDPARQRDRI